MNCVILMGRLCRDPELRTTQNNKTITRFALAVDRKYKTEGGESADFLNCIAFGKTAEFIDKYFKKGSKMCLEGRIQTGSYEKDGVKHYTTDIIVESVEFAESKRVGSETKETNSETKETKTEDGFTLMESETDLPFI